MERTSSASPNSAAVEDLPLPVSSDSDEKESGEPLTWEKDPANPKNFSKARKWSIAGAAMVAALLMPMNGTSITAATSEIRAAFNISDNPFPNSFWTVTSWALGGAAFLIVGLSLMEDLGVRRGFLGLYAFFFLMIIPQVRSQSIRESFLLT